MSPDSESQTNELQRCVYVFRDKNFAKGKGEQCSEPVYSDGKCILHIGLPDDQSRSEYKDLAARKAERVAEKAAKDDFNFEGAILPSIDFSEWSVPNLNFVDASIWEHALFEGATINGNVSFVGATIVGNVLFRDAIIKKKASFWEASIKGRASFVNVKIGGRASFVKATIEDNAYFEEACIGEYASFDGATINGEASFDKARIGGNVWFDNATIKEGVWLNGVKVKGHVSFEGAKIGGGAWFRQASIGGDASFERAELQKEIYAEGVSGAPQAQAAIYRKAKQVWSGLGDRDKADYYFYHEMVAKRELKKPTFSFRDAVHRSERKNPKDDIPSIKKYVRSYAEYFLEWPIQHVTGYWVYPARVIRAFAIFVLCFGFLFWFIAQDFTVTALDDSVWCSFLTLFNPIGKIENAQPGLFGAVTVIAGFIGPLTWPVFIAILAKKYGR
jgi:uncharacterized protein YjbI with pentapeptide repeats